MTLGKKLSIYRRIAGLTQQQLGEHLNLSAQAISKWENNLAEPDLSTLRALADLYKVSIDDLLSPDDAIPEMNDRTETEPSETPSEPEVPATPIGFCKHCGITVTEENLGTTEPVIACKRCLAEQQKAERRAAEEQERKAREAIAQKKRKEKINRAALRKKRKKSFITAGLVTVVFLAVMIESMVSHFSIGMLAFSLIALYPVFAFVSCLFYDCMVQDVVVDWLSKSVHWPGLIFSFDLDGFLWLICMKLLFFILGILCGIFTGIVGVTLGLLIAPFVFPFVMQKVNRALENGDPL